MPKTATSPTTGARENGENTSNLEPLCGLLLFLLENVLVNKIMLNIIN